MVKDCKNLKYFEAKPGIFRRRNTYKKRATKKLVSSNYIYNLIYYCFDILATPPPPSSLCGPEQIVCGDGSCVNSNRVCDGYFDCIDGKDERDCGMF